MSRLYGRLMSDRRKTDATVGANETMTCKLTWGSANEPENVAVMQVVWDKEWKRPTLWIEVSQSIDAQVKYGGDEVFMSDPK